MYVSLYLSLSLSCRLSVYLSVRLSVFLSACLPACLAGGRSVRRSVGLSVSVRLSVCLCVCVAVCMYVCTYACMYVCTSVCMYVRVGARVNVITYVICVCRETKRVSVNRQEYSLYIYIYIYIYIQNEGSGSSLCGNTGIARVPRSAKAHHQRRQRAITDLASKAPSSSSTGKAANPLLTVCWHTPVPSGLGSPVGTPQPTGLQGATAQHGSQEQRQRPRMGQRWPRLLGLLAVVVGQAAVWPAPHPLAVRGQIFSHHGRHETSTGRSCNGEQAQGGDGHLHRGRHPRQIRAESPQPSQEARRQAEEEFQRVGGPQGKVGDLPAGVAADLRKRASAVQGQGAEAPGGEGGAPGTRPWRTCRRSSWRRRPRSRRPSRPRPWTTTSERTGMP